MNDPLHYEFAGGVIMIPLGIVRKHEDYINRMSLLCRNSSSRSPENFHTIIEDSDSNREEIDIFSGPDDSIPPGIESDFNSEEDIIDNLLNDDPIPKYERLTFDMEPNVPVINNVNEDECFDPGGGYAVSWKYTRRTKNDSVKYEWNAKQGLVGNLKSSCTDKTNITRKSSKTGKHGIEERKSTKEARNSKPKSKSQNSQSTLGQLSQH
ncbi:hypothetical protein Tco_0800254 [Tanacetum coccineum]|uniref:Uncharacterized protein n=1 Tax=Tanacetum coccineum TaxID=301880 RepID=A0ABQ4ZVA7_9ASTR